MAERRMFSKKIIDTDLFLDMPISSRLLYYDLSMRADDDGFVSSPKKITRLIGASDDDLKLLITKQFIIPFVSGICVIKDWKIHNYIQKDRYHETQYTNEKKQLTTEENGMYTKCIQDVSNLDTEVRLELGKVRLELGKVILDNNVDDNNKVFSKTKQKRCKSNASLLYFEKIWEQYPNKQGKAIAFKHFEKAVSEGVSVEKIEKAIQDYCFYIKQKCITTQYIRKGGNWFRDKGWEDDYIVIIENKEPSRKKTVCEINQEVMNNFFENKNQENNENVFDYGKLEEFHDTNTNVRLLDYPSS